MYFIFLIQIEPLYQYDLRPTKYARKGGVDIAYLRGAKVVQLFAFLYYLPFLILYM